jgi:hypothetical protein
MFSSTTIESSTKMPMISERPISDIESRWKPNAFIKTKVERIDVGIETMTTTALRHRCRKSIMTIIVSRTPSKSDCQTPLSERCV